MGTHSLLTLHTRDQRPETRDQRPETRMVLPVIPMAALLIPLAYSFPLAEEGSGEIIEIQDIEINGASLENIGGILDILISSGDSVKNVIDKFNDATQAKAVQELVDEAEEIIVRLQQGVGEINEKHRTFAGEALKEMLHIKVLLKNSRLSLNELAKRTVFAVDDLKAFSEAIFANDNNEDYETNDLLDLRSSMPSSQDYVEKMEYVKEQMTVMKNLIADTKAKVDEVKKIYSDVKLRMTKIEENLISYKVMVSHLLKNETSEGVNKASGARTAIYSSAGASTVLCIVVDILGAMGICSGINGAAVATSAITLETALFKMKENLETLERDGELAIADVQKLMKDQEDIEDYLYKEEQALAFWVAALEGVERKIANPDRIFFQTLPVIRERYLQSLQDLGEAAQSYLDQEEL